MAQPTARLTYPRPVRTVSPTPWSRRWRRRWSETIGPVMVDRPSGDLVAVYAPSTPPALRLALQSELESRAHGTAQIIAACRLGTQIRAPISPEHARDWVRRWYAAGGTISFGSGGWRLVQGANTEATLAEWKMIKPTIARLAFPGGSSHRHPARSGGRR